MLQSKFNLSIGKTFVLGGILLLTLPAESLAGADRKGGAQATRPSSGGAASRSSSSSPPPSTRAVQPRTPQSSNRGTGAPATRHRPRHPGSGGSYNYGRHYYGSYPYYPYYSPSWYWGSYYPFPYSRHYPYSYGYYPYGVREYRSVPTQPRAALGALNLKVKPKAAAVYVDGEHVGPVDQFNGYPGYLWLEQGGHDLVFYLESHETVFRRVTVHPNTVITVKSALPKGEPAPFSDFIKPEKAEAPEMASAVEPPALEPGRLHVSIAPSDASVYLDGRILGTADQLDRLHAGLTVDAGKHRVEIVRPGYESEEIEIEVESGREVEVSLALRPKMP